MKRVAILGNSGTGKSRLATILGTVTGLPVVHLDRHFWRPGWTETPRAEWVEVHRRLIEPAEWILDGNYGSTMEERLERADTAIFLEVSRPLSFLRVLRRALSTFGRTRPDLGPRCPERFPDGGFVEWIWSYPRKVRPVVLDRLAAFERRGGVVHHLRGRRAVRAFVRGLR